MSKNIATDVRVDTAVQRGSGITSQLVPYFDPESEPLGPCHSENSSENQEKDEVGNYKPQFPIIEDNT